MQFKTRRHSSLDEILNVCHRIADEINNRTTTKEYRQSRLRAIMNAKLQPQTEILPMPPGVDPRQLEPQSHWICRGRRFNFDADPGDSVGFAYLMAMKNGNLYPGINTYSDDVLRYRGGGAAKHNGYDRMYGTNGIMRYIVGLAYDPDELAEIEMRIIDELGAVEDPVYLNRDPGGRFQALRDRFPITAVKENGEAYTFKNEIAMADQVGNFMGRPIKISPMILRRCLRGESFWYLENGLRTMFYADSTAVEMADLERKRYDYFVHLAKETSQHPIVVEFEPGALPDGAEKRIFVSAGMAARKLRELLGIKTSLIQIAHIADGDLLVYREMEGIKDIYRFENELDGTLHLLEEKRAHVEHNKTYGHNAVNLKFHFDTRIFKKYLGYPEAAKDLETAVGKLMGWISEKKRRHQIKTKYGIVVRIEKNNETVYDIKTALPPNKSQMGIYVFYFKDGSRVELFGSKNTSNYFQKSIASVNGWRRIKNERISRSFINTFRGTVVRFEYNGRVIYDERYGKSNISRI